VIDSAAVLAPSPARVVAFLAVVVAAVVVFGGVDGAASTPPSSTTLPLPPGDAFPVPGSDAVLRFSTPPVVITDPDGTSPGYYAGVEEDTEALRVLPPTAFGAPPGATAAERVLLFLDASGEAIEVLANTQTRLGPYPAAYFVSRITLADRRPAVLYGAAVVRPADVSYVFYTDIGGDDSDRGRAFVESYAVTIDPYPAPTTTTIAATPAPTAVPGPSPATSSSAPPTTTSTTTASTTTLPGHTVVSFGGGWSVRLPSGAEVSLRASSQDGFAFADYVSVVGDDALSVRVTELPVAFEWSPAGAATLDAERNGGTVLESTLTSVDGAPGARFTLAGDNGEAFGDTTEVLLVRDGGQLYRIAYADGGEPSPAAAAEFIESFHRP
jgi:hypothetical protein